MKKQDLSRRDFVKSTAAVTAASVAGAAFTIVKAESVRGTKANSTVQIGWVGQGGQGTRDAQLLEQTGKAKIVALADYFQYRLDKAKVPFKVDDKKCYRGIDAYKAIMTDKEKAAFENNQLVIRDNVVEGHRVFSAFQPPIFIKKLF